MFFFRWFPTVTSSCEYTLCERERECVCVCLWGLRGSLGSTAPKRKLCFSTIQATNNGNSLPACHVLWMSVSQWWMLVGYPFMLNIRRFCHPTCCLWWSQGDHVLRVTFWCVHNTNGSYHCYGLLRMAGNSVWINDGCFVECKVKVEEVVDYAGYKRQFIHTLCLVLNTIEAPFILNRLCGCVAVLRNCDVFR